VDEHGKIIGRAPPAAPHNWGRWGEHDKKGTANFLGPERIAEAAKLIRTGVAYSLARPIEKGGPVHPGSSDIVHLYAYSGADFIAGTKLNDKIPRFQGSDDYVFMPLQDSTQWDALAHCGYEDALYNGFWLGKVESYAGATRCSIHQPRETMIGRGVLLDLARHQDVERLPPGHAITADELDACAQAQGVEIRSGDMLLVRTGHVAWFYRLDDKREFWRDGAPGFGKTTVEWAHRKQLAAVAVDNVGVEDEPFEEPFDVIYPLHVRFLRDLGLILGELFWLESLAEACAADGAYEFFLTAPPLNFTNASGSPLNPIAIK
jgi:kynurenine formamidase